MKKITSVTMFNDAVGMRLSATYSEIDDTTGRIISDNQRYDRVITDDGALDATDYLMRYAKNSLPE